jgi:hypothetical protein
MIRNYLGKRPLILRLLILLIGYSIILAILATLVNIFNITITSGLVLIGLTIFSVALIMSLFAGLYQLSKNYFGEWLPQWSPWWDGILSGWLFLTLTICTSLIVQERSLIYILPILLIFTLIFQVDHYSREKFNPTQLLFLRGLLFLLLILGISILISLT